MTGGMFFFSKAYRSHHHCRCVLFLARGCSQPDYNMKDRRYNSSHCCNAGPSNTGGVSLLVYHSDGENFARRHPDSSKMCSRNFGGTLIHESWRYLERMSRWSSGTANSPCSGRGVISLRASCCRKRPNKIQASSLGVGPFLVLTSPSTVPTLYIADTVKPIASSSAVRLALTVGHRPQVTRFERLVGGSKKK